MLIKLPREFEVIRLYIQTVCMMFFPSETYSILEDAEHSVILGIEIKNRVNSTAVTISVHTSEKQSQADYAAENPEEIASKRYIGNCIYQILSDFCGTRPSWGSITGVRPTKLGAVYLAGYGDNAAIKLAEDYLCDPGKAKLAVDTYLRGEQIARQLPAKTCSLYVSIPFCPTRCNYCSFTSYSTPRLLGLIPAYLERLKDELHLTAELIYRNGLQISTVYIGGGTPSTLSASQLEDLLSALSRLVDISKLDEFTVECGRPDTVTREKMDVLKKYSVNRVSINPQTLNDEVLSQIGRAHTTDDFYRAYEMARETGIERINTDLIAGLPHDNTDSYLRGIERIIALSPDNITQHTFCVKRSAEIKHADADAFDNKGGDIAYSVRESYNLLDAANYRPYYMYRQKYTAENLENTGFEKNNTACLYNIYMMEELHSIFAVGAGGVTKIVSPDRTHIRRIGQAKYPYEYIDGDFPLVNEENLRLIETVLND